MFEFKINYSDNYKLFEFQIILNTELNSDYLLKTLMNKNSSQIILPLTCFLIKLQPV